MKSAEDWIQHLNMVPLPEEGGMYKEIYRSEEKIAQAALPKRFNGKRCFSTSIYYLLKSPEFSAWHRILQEEIWHFYEGHGLTVHVIDAKGNYSAHKMGRDFENGETLQLVIKAGDLFAATVEKETYALVGCTVAPGFEFADFEAPSRAVLLEKYPQHRDVILRLTR